VSEPWLVVIDPQRVFASADSPWGSPMFESVVGPIRALAAQHRSLVTRWLPATGAERTGSWRAYFEAWPFADQPPGHALFDLVPELADLAGGSTVDATSFGKWPALEAVTGPAPELILTGVATDCCVVSTALAAADAGATVKVVARACAGSTPENHARALDVMRLFSPQITVV
jgi:nicotinamidase-related amidase